LKGILANREEAVAKAKVYFRFDGPGNGWQGPQGEGSSRQADGNTSRNHAERQAWRQAGKGLQAWYDQRVAHAADQGVEVKIWVDQVVCPSCQLWMIAGVLRNLGAFAFRPKLFVEVQGMGSIQMMEVTRNAIWPVNIGHGNVQTLSALKAAGVSMDE
jgi:hypothetical protein